MGVEVVHSSTRMLGPRDPIGGVVTERYHLGQIPRALRGPERIDLDNLLPGFELTVQDLFASLRLR